MAHCLGSNSSGASNRSSGRAGGGSGLDALALGESDMNRFRSQFPQNAIAKLCPGTLDTLLDGLGRLPELGPDRLARLSVPVSSFDDFVIGLAEFREAFEQRENRLAEGIAAARYQALELGGISAESRQYARILCRAMPRSQPAKGRFSS